MAHKWARWLHNPCHLGGPHRFRAGGRNRKWPTSGQGGYITPATLGVPTASDRGGQNQEVAHKWARWLHNTCRLAGPHRFRAGGQNQMWPTSGQGGYITPAAWEVPTASDRGAESDMAHKWARWLYNPCHLRDPHRFRAGGQNRRWPTSGQDGYITPATWGVPTASERGGRNQKWPTSGQGGYITPAAWGVPTASDRGGRIRKWPTSGQGGYITPAAWGVPTASYRGAESEVAHKWARWLHNPCRMGGPHRFTAGGRIGGGPQVGKVAT